MKNLDLIDPVEYDLTVAKLRDFFRIKRFIETPVQHRLSILAACEDPRTIGTFTYAGQNWPLPQTGQMWLEYELLNNPSSTGDYCISTSYRNEPNPIEGRHNLIFPMFEFETHGDIEHLAELEVELLIYLGFNKSPRQSWWITPAFPGDSYKHMAEHYGVKELTAEHETKIHEEFGPVFFLSRFPQYTSPFWNMKKVDDIANKIDVLLYGIETIGSAERSTDPEEMRHLFHTISSGMYADILYAQFGKERVEEELEKFLTHKLFPRCGGGIGITRMIRALKLAEVLQPVR